MAIATFAQKRARVQAISSTIQAEFITAESEDQFKLPALQIEKPASNNQSQHAIPKIGQHPRTESLGTARSGTEIAPSGHEPVFVWFRHTAYTFVTNTISTCQTDT